MKLSIAINLFYWHLDAFAAADDPRPGFLAAMDVACFLLGRAKTQQIGAFEPAGSSSRTKMDVGALYGDSWLQLTDANYFEETQARLSQRLLVNRIDPAALFRDKRVLDAGCGSGNYTLSIADLGAREVIGIDISEEGLEFGRAKAHRAKRGVNVCYRLGSADAIPLDDDSVDLVWSNSVVHVTGNYEKCIQEAARVLKRNGLLFLYVDGYMGLFQILVDALLDLMADVPPILTRHYLTSLNIDPGRIGWMMAIFYVFYERRPRVAVERLLQECGFVDLRLLGRGLPGDQSEQLATNAPFAKLKYGEGTLKYLAVKA